MSAPRPCRNAPSLRDPAAVPTLTPSQRRNAMAVIDQAAAGGQPFTPAELAAYTDILAGTVGVPRIVALMEQGTLVQDSPHLRVIERLLLRAIQQPCCRHPHPTQRARSNRH